MLHACCLPCPPFCLGTPPTLSVLGPPRQPPVLPGPPCQPHVLPGPPSAPRSAWARPQQPPARPRWEQLFHRSTRGPRCPALPSALQALCHLLAFSRKGSPFSASGPARLASRPRSLRRRTGFQRLQGSLLTGTRHFPWSPQPVPRAHPPHGFSPPVSPRSTSTRAIYSVKSMPDLTLKIKEIKSEHIGQTDLQTWEK